MVEDYVFVHVNQFASFRVRFHVRMAIGTWKDVFGKGWRRHWVCFALVSMTFVLFNLFLDNQIAGTVEELFDLGSRDYGGTKSHQANGQR